MPALSKIIYGFIPFFIFIIVSACSRNNPLSIPPPFVVPEKAFCSDKSPYIFELLSDISIANSNVKLTPSYLFHEFKYSLDVDYLVNSITVKPIQVDKITEVFFTDIVPKSDAYVDELGNLKTPPFDLIDINSLNIDIVFNDINGERVTELLPIDTAINLPLPEGVSSFDILVSGQIEIPVTGLECIDESAVSTPSEGTGGPANQPTLTRISDVNDKYTIDIKRSTITEVTSQTLLPSSLPSLDTGDEFGRILAMTDKYLAMGVPNDDSNARGVYNSVNSVDTNNDSENSGAVYIFKMNDAGIWEYSSFIKSSNSEAGDLFGSSVSLRGDVLVVSALGEDGFGAGIYPWADLNGDGVNDDEISANAEVSNLAPSSGAIYTFEATNDISQPWKQTAYIKPQDNVVAFDGYNDAFGAKVLLRDNILLIAAPKKDSGIVNAFNASGPNSGIVYIYQYSASSKQWSFFQSITPLVSVSGAAFGSSLAMQNSRVVVGSPGENGKHNGIIQGEVSEADQQNIMSDQSKPGSGAAYIFDKDLTNNIWVQTAYLKASNSDTGDLFGTSVSVSDDIVAIGASHEDSSGIGFNRDMNFNDSIDSGAVYIYSVKNGIWSETAYIKAPDTQEGATFGSHLAFENKNLFVSAPLYDVSAMTTDAGKYYLFFSGDEWQIQDQSQVTKNVGESSAERLGQTISMFGSQYAVGASAFTDGSRQNVGKVTVFK